MRALVDVDKLNRFMRELGRRATGPGRAYLTGGATALLVGWRPTTVDVDIKLDPEPAGTLEAIARLKDELVSAAALRDGLTQIEPELIRYPSLDTDAFRRRVTAFIEAVDA